MENKTARLETSFSYFSEMQNFPSEKILLRFWPRSFLAFGQKNRARSAKKGPSKYEKLVLLTLCFVFLIGGCGRKGVGQKSSERIEKAVKSEVKKKEDIDFKQHVYNFKLESITKTGENKWYIEGDSAKIIDSNIVLGKIKGQSFSKDIYVTLTADKGVYNRDSRSIELNGNIIVTTSDGGKLSMNFAQWNAEKEEIQTDSWVKMEHSGIILEGEGALLRPKQKWAMLEREIKVSDSLGRIINCDGPLEVNYGERKAIFNNNVEIIDPEGKMYADRLVAYFDPDKKAIEKLEWIGDVKAVY